MKKEYFFSPGTRTHMICWAVVGTASDKKLAFIP